MSVAFALAGTLLALAAFGAALWPLWRQARPLALAAAATLGLASFALYRIVGTPAALQAPAAAAAPRSLDEAIAQLRQALQRDPGQAEGWMLLGRSLAGQQKFAEARDAFARALALRPDEPEVLVAAAQSRLLAAAGEQRLDTEAVRLLERALALEPGHQRARWFLGVAHRQGGQPAAAAEAWQPLLAVVDEATRASLVEQIQHARQDAGLPPLDAPAPANGLRVRVSLDPQFAARARLRGDASVFVIARAPGGPAMPVAVEKHALRELPLTLVLDDGDSPMPAQKLSSLREVEILARLSSSGSATRQDGDLESAPVRVSLPAAAQIELVLGR